MAEQAKTKTTKKTAVRKTPVKKVKTELAALSIPLYGVDGAEMKTVELPSIFNSEASAQLMAQYMRVYLANQRRGTASTKTRAEVIGTTAKVYRQKGTGRARHGSRKANIFKGGGVTFGPKPTDYSLKMNKKQKRKALMGALSLKAKDKAIIGFADEFLTIEPKTKTIVALMKKLALNEKKTLIVLPKADSKSGITLASRNIDRVTLTAAHQINPYMIMHNTTIIFVESALAVVASHFGENNEK